MILTLGISLPEGVHKHGGQGSHACICCIKEEILAAVMIQGKQTPDIVPLPTQSSGVLCT